MDYGVSGGWGNTMGRLPMYKHMGDEVLVLDVLQKEMIYANCG